jgi:hypothetical protein
MAIDTTAPRSRRALLVGAAGGLAALAAQALGRPLPARAANGDPVLLGKSNLGTDVTYIVNTSSGDIETLVVLKENGTAMRGSTTSGIGVEGSSGVGRGVHGFSRDNYGVHGVSSNTYGVFGESPSSYAVVGQSESSAGVAGFTASGIGVIGASSSLVGVQGQGGSGRGGRFSGGKAQVKLDPSTAATHPASGQAGDIFLDKSKRLWLCKGGSTWVRLDL